MSQGGVSWPPVAGIRHSGELPEAVGDWSLTQVTAGWWLSATGRDVPGTVGALSAEPGRPSVIIDASEPGPSTDQLLSQLFPMLSAAGLSTVRLVLSAAADRYAAAASRAHDIDVIAAEDAVVITPHGYALVRSAEPAGHGDLPQWWRCLPGGDRSAAGALAPSPAWERGLHADVGANLGGRMAAHRVPAGLALQPSGPDDVATRAAYDVWPDPERLSIVVDPAAPGDAVRNSLTQLLARLSLDVTDGVRLWWPRAGAGASGAVVQELATRFGTDLIVPAADITSSGYGGMCHGPAGAAPWLEFGRAGDVNVLGSRYPVPAWERALGPTDLEGLASDVLFEHVAAGICIYRPEPSQRGLMATARSIIPDPARATIVVGGQARAEVVRRDVESVLSRLPGLAASGLRLVLTDAGSGGEDSYAQFLADTFGIEIVAPAARWTATPDGRLRALAAPGAGPGPAADAWRVFSPSREPAARPPAARPPGTLETTRAAATPSAIDRPVLVPPSIEPPTDGRPTAEPSAGPPPAAGPDWSAPPSPSATSPAADPSAQPSQAGQTPQPVVPGVPRLAVPEQSVPEQSVPEQSVPEQSVPEQSVPGQAVAESSGHASERPGHTTHHTTSRVPGQITLLTRDHRSTMKERLAYRESASRYQSYSISVRRMLTQRPGLRSAVAGDSEDTVITDFAAVLDLLGDDRQAVAATLRSTGTTGNPRVACALSGLRRLPSFTGVVFTSATLLGVAATGYVTGGVIVEPAFVDVSSSRLVATEGDIDYVIWSERGKRVAALAAEAGRDEVIFAAGTSYRVLRVDPARPGSSQVRVFLREFGSPGRAEVTGAPAPADQPDGPLDQMDRRVLERLAAAAARRDDAVSDDQVLARRPGGANLPIGLDASGVPLVQLTPEG